MASLISLRYGNIVAGPLKQFIPTTSAPLCSSSLHVSTIETPSLIIFSAIGAMLITAGSPDFLIISSAL